MGITEFARRRGVSKTAVQRAIREKRLKRSVYRLASGRVLIEVQAGTIEWRENTDPGLSRAGKVLKRRRKRSKTKASGTAPAAPLAKTKAPIPETNGALNGTHGEAAAAVGVEEKAEEAEATYRQILSREKGFRAELARVELDRRLGLLVNAQDVKREVAARARRLRERVMELPDRLADELAGEPDALRVRSILERELREALEEEANRG